LSPCLAGKFPKTPRKSPCLAGTFAMDDKEEEVGVDEKEERRSPENKG